MRDYLAKLYFKESSAGCGRFHDDDDDDGVSMPPSQEQDFDVCGLDLSSLFSLILLMLNSEFILPTTDNSLVPILLLGIGSSGVAFLSFYNLIDDVGAIVGSITVYIIPVFAALFGFIFLNEITTVSQMLGVVIVIFSAFKFSRS